MKKKKKKKKGNRRREDPNHTIPAQHAITQASNLKNTLLSCSSASCECLQAVGKWDTGYLLKFVRSPGLVSAGPVCWTEKKTEIELNPTAKDRTTGCSCTNSENFRLPVARFVKKIEKPEKTGLDRLQPVFRPVMCWTLLTHIVP